jgi:hypothetical protein
MRAPGAILVVAVLLAACGGPSASLEPSAGSDSAQPVLSLDDVEAVPVENREETVAMAFDVEAADELVEQVPPDVDFRTSALVCVFLGPRQTTGWSLELLTVSLSGDVLTIRARESVPRGQTRDEVTYPADCGLLTRAALPAGELTVRADDTITGEFIADAVIDVPAPSSP